MKLTATVLSLAVATSACIHHARRSDGVKVSTFNYTATGGPLNWYGLDPEANSDCAKGKHQSPIVIDTEEFQVASGSSLNFDISETDKAEFENLGSTIEVPLKNGKITVQDTDFFLTQFHFHTPSEHRIDDEHYPMEAHFVFKSSDKRISVVGFLFELTSDYTDLPFAEVFLHVSDIKEPGTSTHTGSLDFSTLMQHISDHNIYQYSGSLTTPPCSEHVAWYISPKPMSLSVHDYNKVKKVVKYNARYTQNTLGQDNLLEVAAKSLG
ncbi:alpha carbonic anhydrase [Aspergillus ambiguus]|uniref:carbonic anhydrase family protein n=1 Tax=Aspergillus ambiguus TaxID=176160 RepID=UPI003CCDEE2F